MKPIAAVSAKSGALWVLRGWHLFKQQPMQLSGLFLLNVFLTIFLGGIPFLGVFLPLILIPLLTMSLMRGCVLVERGEKIGFPVALAAFRSKALPTLLALGVLYLFLILLALLASRYVDDGLFWKVASGQLQIDPSTKTPPDFRAGMLAAFGFYLPASLLLWYAAPLILWQKMSLSKALFYSLVTVWRIRSAFLIYILTWLFACFVLPGVVMAIFAGLFHSPSLALLFILPYFSICNVVLYCSFYPGYADIFGQPDLEALE